MPSRATTHEGPRHATGLTRRLGLLALAATGICSMMGAAINIIPIMIQRNVPGIGAQVLAAYSFAAVPALLAALAYAVLASAMPRAGGSYVYASRGLHPYLGFVASFSQWFGLSIAIGVVSYVTVPFLRDVAVTMEWSAVATTLETGSVRLGLALAFLWFFVGVNVAGVTLYTRLLVPMMFLMFALGSVVIVAGFAFDHADFALAVQARGEPLAPGMGGAATLGGTVADTLGGAGRGGWGTFLAASAVLFSSFIGFDSIAQAGGEAKNPERNLPLAIGIAVVGVGSFYLLFTAAIYHAVPWEFVAARAQEQDLTAPGLLGYLLSPGWTVLIVAGAAIALVNDLPAMLLAVSRLMFAWAEDGIFPRVVARVHPVRHTPHVAIVASGAVATVGVVGSHLAGDFFLGVDILVTSMLVNFLLMCVTVLTLPHRNPHLASRVRVLSARWAQRLVGVTGVALLGLFLGVHLWKDLTAELDAWYFHSTPIWLVVMTLATLVYLGETRSLRAAGVDLEACFATLPPE